MRDLSTVDGTSQRSSFEISDRLSLRVAERLGDELPTDIVLDVWLHPPGDHIDFSFRGSPIPAIGGVVVVGENARIRIPMDADVIAEAAEGRGFLNDTSGYLRSVTGGR